MTYLLLLTALATAGEAPCDTPRTAADLKAATARATLSFLGADLSGYQVARQEAWATLPCVDEIVPQTQVTSLHQLAALDGFYQRDDAMRDGALRALRLRDYDLPEVFAAPHPLHTAWSELDASASAEPLPVPQSVILLLDGEVSLDWPANRTVFVQVLDPGGGVEHTALFRPGDAPPSYVAGDAMSRDAYLAREVRLERRPVELVVAGGALVAGAGGLFALSRVARGRFNDPNTPSPKVESLRAQHNGLLLGAGGALGLGTALGLTAAATW